MKDFWKELLKSFLILVMFIAILAGAFFFATSAKVWFANQHDSMCEGEHCNCYERFINQK